MSVRRGPLAFESRFTQIPNAWARDRTLSRKARGLLVELMSHREGFVVSLASLVENGLEGRDAVSSGLNELRAAGYLRIAQGRGEGGRFGEVEFELVDPASSPLPDYPGAVEPGAADPTPKNTTPSENTISLKNTQATRAETLLGLEDDGVPRTRGLERDRDDVERLAEGTVRLWRESNPRAKIDRTALRTARKLLDDFRTTPDEVLSVLRFAISDGFWADKAHSWASLDRNFASMRRKASTQGPGEPVAADYASTGSPDLAVYFSGSYGQQQREALLLSRSIDPGRFWDEGRDQEALLRRALATAPTYPVGSREHHELLLAWEFRGQGQTLRGAVAAWEPVRV